MADIFQIQNLAFTYPEQREPVLNGVSLNVYQGEFLVLCGPSGCGKSTLLRQLKTVLAPHGRRSGTILFEGASLEDLDQRTQSSKIGFVQQSPENQTVTDKVWLELAFGLESLGYDTPTIRRRAAVMDRGKLLCTGTPQEVGTELKGAGHSMFLAMPTAMRVWAATPNDAPCPVTVREGRDWLEGFSQGHEWKPIPEEVRHAYPDETAIQAEELWFKYEKDLPDVVRGLSLTVKKGEFLALLGGNGTGKTTSLKLLSGLLEPYRGTVSTQGRVGVLPQDPQALFVKKTVREDLLEIFRDSRQPQEEKEARLAHMTALCRLGELLDRHPYDLSGGKQQRCALAKVLLLDPDILLMDEPAKGLDAEFKLVFAEILQTLLCRGITILMVSHDIEFCARYAHRCALFFDGSIVTDAPPRAFFSGNSFYTASANRMARSLLPEAVTAEDVMAACGGELPPAPALSEDIPPLPEPNAEIPNAKPAPLPVWRKVLAAVSGTAAMFLFI